MSVRALHGVDAHETVWPSMIDEFTAARQDAQQLCDRVRLLEARARHAREQGRAAWLACERLVQRTASAQTPEPPGDQPSSRTG